MFFVFRQDVGIRFSNNFHVRVQCVIEEVSFIGSRKTHFGWWCGLAVLPGAAVLLGILSPAEQYQWLALGAFVPLALVLRRVNPVSGLLAGALFGTVSWAAGTYWLLNSMDLLMGLPIWTAWGSTILIWLYQSLPFAVLGLVCGCLNRHGHVAGPVFCASLLTLLVFIRPPFCPVSSVVSVALWPVFIQIADLGGEHFVFFFLVLINWLLADFLVCLEQGGGKQILFRATVLAVVLGGVLGYGEWRLAQLEKAAHRAGSRSLSVATVQPNVPVRWNQDGQPHDEFVTDEARCLKTLSSHDEAVLGADLLVFPELPELDCKGSGFGLSGLETKLHRLGIPVLIPSDEFHYATKSLQDRSTDEGERTVIVRRILAKYNSVFFMVPGGEPALAYRKSRLVPFSEATPLRTRFPWLQKVFGRSLEVTEGDGPRLVRVHGLEIQPLVCFESGFSGLVRQGVSMGADALVEVANDGWFASRDAEMKHLGMGIFRTVEFRRPLVRCSNSGCGAHVLASGELVPGTLTPHGRSCVTRAIVRMSDETTLYAQWGNTWLWFLGLIVFGTLGLVILLPAGYQGAFFQTACKTSYR